MLRLRKDRVFWHKKIVPLEHCLLWLTSFFLSVYGYSLFGIDTNNDYAVQRFTIGLILIIFIFEIAITFFDVVRTFEVQFVSVKLLNFFPIFILILAVTLCPVIIGCNLEQVSVFLILIASAAKYMEVWITNNFHEYVDNEQYLAGNTYIRGYNRKK